MALSETPNWIYLLLVLLLFALLFVCFVIAKYHKTLIAVLSTLPRDLELLRKFLWWKFVVRLHRKQNATVGNIFASMARKQPDKIALFFENGKWTLDQIDKMGNRVANYFFDQGIRKGDTAALFIENSPEYIFIFLGLSKIGVKISLVNTTLRLQQLKYCIESVPNKIFIFNSDLAAAVEGVKIIGCLNDTPLYVLGQMEAESYPTLKMATDLNKALKDASIFNSRESEEPSYTDDLCYVFTSGTTRQPKAVRLTHSDFISKSSSGRILHFLTCSDVIYVCLPIYHSSGLISGVGQLLVSGCKVVISKNFSAVNFFTDCCRFNATVAPYSGEMCRYLIMTPLSPSDTQHRLKLLYGSGLRMEIWETFMNRFKIPKINECYDSTEGNCDMANIDTRIGAVGFCLRYCSQLNPVCVVKLDDETGELIRHPTTGMAFKCSVDEPGEMIGKIVESVPGRSFDSYSDKSSTKNKILKDVFTKGDVWIRTGDLMMMDIYGYLYFKDRTIDSFRWRGETVSTYEVESVISSLCSLSDVVVYGVHILGFEGKACMAAIANPNGSLNLDKLAGGLTASLPNYAIPLFLRAVNELEITGTFKLKKAKFQREAFDIYRIQDPLYFWKEGDYIPLDENIHKDVCSAKVSSLFYPRDVFLR